MRLTVVGSLAWAPCTFKRSVHCCRLAAKLVDADGGDGREGVDIDVGGDGQRGAVCHLTGLPP